MSGNIQKWGDDLAIRIPEGLASEMRFEPGTPVQIVRENGRIVITPSVETGPSYTLEELVAGITAENRHTEIDTGGPQGKEIW